MAWLKGVRRRWSFIAGFLLLVAPSGTAAEAPRAREETGGEARRVGPVPEEVRREFGLSPFYQKYVSANGLPVVSSAKSADSALLEAA